MARGKEKEELSLEEKLEQALVPVEEWPYEVPGNWCWVKLEFACSCPITDGTHKTPTYCEKNDGVPFVSAKDITSEYIDWSNVKYIVSDLHQELYKRLAPQKNDILLAKNGTTGVAALVETNDIFDLYVTIAVLRPNIGIMRPKFLYRLINSPICKKQFDSHLTGIGVPNLHLRDIKRVFIPLPPLSEQRCIVERIENLFAKLDEAKEKAQAVVDGFELRKSAILHKAFTGKLTEQWRKEHGLELDSWEKRNIQSVCAMKITDGTHKTPIYCEADEGIPFISAKDVTSGKICWDNIKYIIPELHKELYKRLAPQIDDVLLAKNGTTGVAAIVEEEKIFDLYVTLAVLRPDKEIIFPRYLLNIVNSPICKNQFDEHLTGIGVPNLHLRDIKEVLLNVPSLEEQIEIVHIIDKIMAKEQQAKEIAESVLEQIDTMKKAILTRAFCGELGTNDPAEESAVEMMKKIL